MCVYVTRTRINLVRSIFLAPFNKSYFKNVDNNTAEQEFTILLWSSVFIQGIMLHFYFSSTPSILIYITIATLILIKYVILNFSAVFLEQADLFRLYKTTFYLGVIHNGLVCIPTILFNILYLYRLEPNTIQFVNGIFFLLLLPCLSIDSFFCSDRLKKTFHIYILFYTFAPSKFCLWA